MNITRSYRFDGIDGDLKMQDVMKMFRYGFKSIGGIKVESVCSLGQEAGSRNSGYEEVSGRLMLGAVEYHLADGSSITIRPYESEQVLEISLMTSDEGDERPRPEGIHVTPLKTSGGKSDKIHEYEARIWNDLESIVHIDYRAACCYE